MSTQAPNPLVLWKSTFGLRSPKHILIIRCISTSIPQIYRQRSSAGSATQAGLCYGQDALLDGLTQYVANFTFEKAVNTDNTSSMYTNAPLSLSVPTTILSPTFSTPFTPMRPSPSTTPPTGSAPAPVPPRRQRATRTDEPIGLVFENKRKFKCNKTDCKDLTFGRMADLRRHYDQTHATHRVQFYCSVSGCSRSHAPTGGRGRSFGTRKDKRDEHERTVHKKEREYRRDSSYSSGENF